MGNWKNLGDINFLSYGGCLVKPHWTKEELTSGKDGGELLKYGFDVFYLNPEYGENGDQNYAALCFIDLDGLNFDDMLYQCGLDEHLGKTLQELLESGFTPEQLAKEMVELDVVNFNPSVYKNGQYIQYPYNWEDFIVSDEDLKKWLLDIGAKEFI